MKNKLFTLLLCLLILFSSAAAVKADSRTYTVAEAESLCDGIVAYYSGGGYQTFIDRSLCDRAGVSAEFYAIAVSQRGSYDFSRYERALLDYLSSHEVYSASSRLKYALALSASGSTNGYITNTANEAIGGMGIMSLIFGLHILNNGYTSSLYSADGLVSELLSMQLSDGGWALSGSYGDVDVTAMTVQALAPHYYSRSDVRAAVDSAVSMLSKKQLKSGGFSTMNTENCESAAQVVTALSSVGIDPQTDSRFVKSGGSALGAMLSYRLADGSFSHAGGGFSESATCQAFYALTAYLRMQYGQGPLYVLDNAVHLPPQSGGSDTPSDNSGRGSDSSAGSNDTPAEPGNHDNTGGSPPANQPAEKPAASASAPAESSTSPAPTILPSAVRPTHGSFQPSATEDQRSATADSSPSGGPGYKLYAVIGIIAAAGAACLVLFLMKKRGKKHFITVLIIAAAGIVFILLTNFQSVEEYRDVKESDGDLSVTMTIRCDTIKDKEKVNSRIPDDGMILPETQFGINKGETVYDVLLSAAKLYGVAMDNRGTAGSAYIAGINYLYEFDYGDLSGWMYRVDGEFPEVGCQSYTLSGGEKIEWLYTTDIGKDLE